MKDKKEYECFKDLAKKLKSFAHPVRLQILKLLKDENGLNVTAIYQKLNLEQPVASHHLIILNKNGLLIKERIGRENIYKINTEMFDYLLKNLKDCIYKN